MRDICSITPLTSLRQQRLRANEGKNKTLALIKLKNPTHLQTG